MKILNNQDFADFAGELSEKAIAGMRQSGLDALDYRWLLTDVLSSIDNRYLLEIKQDSDGSYELYTVLEAEFNDNQTNILTLKLERIADKFIINRIFDIKDIEDTRIPKHCKYYVDTSNEKYTFLIKK